MRRNALRDSGALCVFGDDVKDHTRIEGLFFYAGSVVPNRAKEKVVDRENPACDVEIMFNSAPNRLWNDDQSFRVSFAAKPEYAVSTFKSDIRGSKLADF